MSRAGVQRLRGLDDSSLFEYDAAGWRALLAADRNRQVERLSGHDVCGRLGQERAGGLEAVLVEQDVNRAGSRSQNRHIRRSVSVKVRDRGLVGESIWERSPGTDKAAIQLAQEDISGTAFPRQGDNIGDAIAVEVSDARTNAAARKWMALAERTIAITGFEIQAAQGNFLLGKVGQTITVEVRHE